LAGSNLWIFNPSYGIIILDYMGKDYTRKSLKRYWFKRPSFFEGMGRVLDLGATMQAYKNEPNELEADAKAIASDWEMVGEDLRTVIADYGTQPDKAAERQ
jgi:hypothetical protein